MQHLLEPYCKHAGLEELRTGVSFSDIGSFELVLKTVLYMKSIMLTILYIRFTEMEDSKWFNKTMCRVIGEECGEMYVSYVEDMHYFVDFLRYSIHRQNKPNPHSTRYLTPTSMFFFCLIDILFSLVCVINHFLFLCFFPFVCLLTPKPMISFFLFPAKWVECCLNRDKAFTYWFSYYIDFLILKSF